MYTALHNLNCTQGRP